MITKLDGLKSGIQLTTKTLALVITQENQQDYIKL